jgi:hypothetical protein
MVRQFEVHLLVLLLQLEDVVVCFAQHRRLNPKKMGEDRRRMQGA